MKLMHDLRQAIDRVRRAMPRNADVMMLCDALEERLVSAAAATPPPAPKFDKRTYQRNLMRERRAKQREQQ